MVKLDTELDLGFDKEGGGPSIGCMFPAAWINCNTSWFSQVYRPIELSLDLSSDAR